MTHFFSSSEILSSGISPHKEVTKIIMPSGRNGRKIRPRETANNEMQKAAMASSVENGQYDNQLAQLVALGREMFRLEKIEETVHN